jgi:hypothetical protein
LDEKEIMKLLSLLPSYILVGILIGNIHALDAENIYLQSCYHKVAQQNLRSFTWEEKDWSDNFNEYLHQCLEVLKEGQPYQKRKHVFELLGTLKLKQSRRSCALMDIVTWQDLQLFYDDNNTQQYLGAIVDRAITELGKVQLLYMIGDPTSNIAVLKKRQEIVKELVEHESLLAEMRRALDCWREHENKIFSFWYSLDPFWQSAHRCYWNMPLLRHLSNSWIMLEAKNRLDHYGRISLFLANIIAAGALTTHGALSIISQDAPSFLTDVKDRFEGSGELGPITSLVKYFLKSPRKKEHRNIHGMLNILAGTYCALGVKEQIEWERDLLFLDTCLQIKLIGIRKCLDCAYRLKNQIKNNKTLVENLTDISSFYEVLQKKVNTQQQKLLTLLSAPTFKGKPSIIASKGKVLLAYKLLREQKELFLKLFTVIAEIDAYCSIAYLYKEFQNERVVYSFAQYIDGEKPYAELEDFWNPFIDKQKVVTNSIILGGNYCQNGIVTGPNTAGKSGNLKAVALCFILGQSLGIVPACKAIFTPFTKIMTHLNIIDDITAGNSLFKSELLRAQAILNTIKRCNQHEFCFVIMDELFNGTTPCEGQAAAYAYAKFIGSRSNVMMLIATHFGLLTQLATVTPHFANYAVSVAYKQDGTIVPTFKLEPGISHQHIALDVLKAEGIDQQIFDDAQALLADPTKKI